jgi:hypothetical protein
MFHAIKSRHSFGKGDVLMDRDGIRGVVRTASALYARVAWEDGRATEVEQSDPAYTVEIRAEDAEYTRWRIRTSYRLWHRAGPKPEEKPHELPQEQEVMPV